jgi:hypothetical protein
MKKGPGSLDLSTLADLAGCREDLPGENRNESLHDFLPYACGKIFFLEGNYVRPLNPQPLELFDIALHFFGGDWVF